MSKIEQKGTILVGDGEELFSFFSSLKHPERVMGVFCSALRSIPDELMRLGDVQDVPVFLDEHPQIQRVYCSSSEINLQDVKLVQYGCKARAVRFCVVLPTVNDLDTKMVTMHVAGKQLMTPQSEPLSHLHNRMLKRSFDLLLTLVFLLIFFPFVYLWKAVSMKIKHRGPSFVTERCCGPNGRVFRQVTFRKEPSSLARLFNVLIGSMSLVGPACYVLGDETEIGNLPKRLERRVIKAGMTGWAQLQGCDEDNRLAADIWYVEHWSLWLDLKILCQSIV